jgi:formylglycine-generating enzyme required for sulfatase activity
MDAEAPQHEVTLTHGYWLGETPVTQALWVAVMGDNPSRFVGDALPVERVSWDDCQAFFDRLNSAFSCFAARLPTEAEWERACRGGTQGATWIGELSSKHSAPELDAIAWYFGNSGGTTHAVAGKAANPYGLYDILGNVWEWCADAPRTYSSASVADPIGHGSSRVYRGGAWRGSARYVRAADRLADEPGRRDDRLGFRLAGGPGRA